MSFLPSLRDNHWVRDTSDDFIGQDFDPTDPEHTTDKTRVKSYILGAMELWRAYDMFDDELLRQYREDFMDWTPEVFKVAERPARETVKRELKHRGIFLASASRKEDLSTQLANLLSLSKPPDFPPEEIEECKKKASAFRSRRYNPNFDGMGHMFITVPPIPGSSMARPSDTSEQ